MEGEDGKWYFSVYDFINFVTGHERGNAYARMTFLRLTKEGSQYASEVVTNCYNLKCNGSGEKITPCMTTVFKNNVFDT